MKGLFVLFMSYFMILLPAFSGAADRSDEKEDLFYRANQLYKEGRYSEAVDGYLQLNKSVIDNGHLYYNLGNAYFRLEQLGHAVLCYERARLLMPRDADLDYNLRYVRQQTRDIIEDDRDSLSMPLFWLDSMTLDEVFWIFAVFNGIFWTALILRLYLKMEWSYYLVVISLAVWIISGVSFGRKWFVIRTDDRAVILDKEVNVLSGPDADDTVLFRLHAGTIVRFEREEDGWSVVSMHDKKRGWVEAHSVGLIRFD